jgi:hypothetical protein
MKRRHLLSAAFAGLVSAAQCGQCADVAFADAETLAPLEPAVLDAMQSWPHALPAVPTVDYARLAHTIAVVADRVDPVRPEKPQARLYTAMLLAGLAYKEGARFALYVADGRCNDTAWRASPEGQRLLHWGGCDGGKACSLWQVHIEGRRDPEGRRVTPEEMLDLEFAATQAADIARKSFAGSKSLCWYAGEWGGACPKAREREEFAEAAYQRALRNLDRAP